MSFVEKYHYGILAIILLLMFSLGIGSMKGDSLTIDEFAHIPAGFTYWKLQDYRLNPEHPPLMKLLAGFPMLFLDPEYDTGTSWKTADQWEFGRRFFFLNNPEKKEQLVFWARMPILLAGLFLCFIVFLFARSLYGVKAGLLAAFFIALEPNILAHSKYVTTDLGVTLFFFLSVYLLWRYLQQPSWQRAVLLGTALGGCLASKFSGILLFPVVILLVFLWFFLKEDKSEGIKGYLKKIKWFFPSFIVALFFVFAVYQFVHFEAFFVGLKDVMLHSEFGHASFLLGSYSFQGWWYYFPVAMFFKTPPALFALLILVVLFWKKIPSLSWKKEFFLIIPFFAYLVFFMMNNINIGVRHILPVYPFLIVFVSKVVNVEIKEKMKKNIFSCCMALLILGFVLSHLLIMPQYLAYFNVFAGGPEKGKEVLLDSNLDWGQDLKRVVSYLKKEGIEEVNIKYFGHEPIEYYGIKAHELGCLPLPGIAVISINALIGLEPYYAECYAWLREKTPIAMPGYSVYVYDIKEEEVDEATKHKALCEQSCREKCNDRFLAYEISSLDEEKVCSCSCKKV